MHHLVVVINFFDKEKGFNLLELIVGFLIISVLAAIGLPNLLESQRQEKVNEAFTRIRKAIVEAQLSANRQSLTCNLLITDTNVTASPSGCILENIIIDNNIISITSTHGMLPVTIPFSFKGTTNKPQTLHIRRKNFAGNAMPKTGKCIVISSIGMIRTGIYDQNIPNTNCNNIENKRYDNSNS